MCEGPVSDACDRVRNRDVRETAAPREGIVSDACDGVRNRDGCEAGAA